MDRNPTAPLSTAGRVLSETARQTILRAGSKAVRPLIAILDDDRLALPDAPGDGWAPLHAVDLLVELRASEAIRPMLGALTRAAFDDKLQRRIVERLPRLGKAVLGPALESLDHTSGARQRYCLCTVLSKIGVRDKRIYRALCALSDEEPILGASLLAEYTASALRRHGGGRRARASAGASDGAMAADTLAPALGRFAEAHWHLHQLTEYYHRVEPFWHALNAFLRVLREVPHAVHAALRQAPGFRFFFARALSELNADPLLSTLSECRDPFVVQCALLARSQVQVGVTASNSGGLKTTLPFPATPAQDSDAILSQFVDACRADPTLRSSVRQREERPCVRRVWRLSWLPDDEVRVVSARAWKRVGKMLEAVAERFGPGAFRLDFPCMALHANVKALIRIYSPELGGGVTTPPWLVSPPGTPGLLEVF